MKMCVLCVNLVAPKNEFQNDFHGVNSHTFPCKIYDIDNGVESQVQCLSAPISVNHKYTHAHVNFCARSMVYYSKYLRHVDTSAYCYRYADV